jgi:uncharacterized membrane protein YkvA (DUF1232 family)
VSGLSSVLPGWAEALAGVGVALLVVWAVAVLVLVRVAPGRPALTQAARLLPDLLRLVAGLARDRDLPRGVRVRLWLLLAYLASPVDLVPDVVPVIGYADDAVLVVLTLRAVVRAAGTEAVARHWPGSDDGLAVVHRLAGLPGGDADRLSTP